MDKLNSGPRGMLLAIAGLAAGIIAGYFLPFAPSASLSPFIAAAALATADALVAYVLFGHEGNIPAGRFVRDWGVALAAALGLIFFGRRIGTSLEPAVLTALTAKIFFRLSFQRKSQPDYE